MTTSVKHFHSDMQGGPVLSGSAGSLIAVLDACLVNGFGLKSVTSIVVADGIATAAINGGNVFEEGDVVLIEGVTTPSALNGQKRLLSATYTHVTFDATGISNQTASGTITAKRAPLGWSKAFSTTNIAVYKATAPEATGFHLQVNDTDPLFARAVGYESMSDVLTGLRAFPNGTQQSGGLYWGKSDASSSAARAWAVFGDERMFYIAIAPHGSRQGNFVIHAFGDPIGYRSGGVYECMIAGDVSANGGRTAASVSCLGGTSVSGSGANQGVFMARPAIGLGGPVTINRIGGMFWGAMPSSTTYSSTPEYSTASVTPAYPNPADGGLMLCPVYLHSAAEQSLRGHLAGIGHTPQNLYAQLPAFTKIPGGGAMSGRTLVAMTVQGPQSNAIQGTAFFDVTGPWRE